MAVIHYLLDEWLGLGAHESLSCAAEAEVLAEVAKVLGKDAETTKTAVMDKVHAV